MNQDEKIELNIQKDPLLPKILQEIGQAQEGTLKRQELIRNFEIESGKIDGKKHKLVVYIAKMSHPRNGNSIASDDVAPMGSILQSLDGPEVIDLIIHSPGGDGNTAEKIVDMCRAYLPPGGQFNVIVPNKAKSAATLIALGADNIIMGYSSELGPIDAQVPINSSGVLQFISAQSFIDARDELLKNVRDAIARGEGYQGYLQLLTTINVAFAKECERAMNFAKDVASKWLFNHMLKEKIPDDTARDSMAKIIATKLSSANTYLSHGRMINVAEIMKDNDLKNLKIVHLKPNDPLWNILWEIYVRSEVFLGINPNPQVMKAKLFESANSSLAALG